MSLGKRLVRFYKDNEFLIVTGSIIVGIHWAWAKIQDNPAFVRPEDKKDLPPIIFARYLKNLAVGKYNEVTKATSPQASTEGPK